MRYGKILLIGSGIGAFASLIGGWALIVTILFPVVWMILENKKEYLTLAIGYYIGVSLEDPWLVKNFLEHFTPHHGIINGSLGVIGTGIAVLLLSLTWVFPNPKTFGEEYRYLTGGLSLLVVMCALPLVPGFELNGYASPLVSAGLLFPGTGYAGIILEILAITGVAYLAKSDLTQTKNRTKNVTILAGILLIPLSINVFFAQKSHEKIDAIGKKTLMVIDPINNASSFLQTIKDIDTGINDHDITVLPEGEIGVLTPQKIMALDKMNAYALLKKKAVIGTGTLVTVTKQKAFIIGLGFSKNVLFEPERYVIPVINLIGKGDFETEKESGGKPIQWKDTVILPSVCFQDVLFGELLKTNFEARKMRGKRIVAEIVTDRPNGATPDRLNGATWRV